MPASHVDATGVFNTDWGIASPINVPVADIVGLQDGDELTAFCLHRAGASDVSPPTGWIPVEEKNGSGGAWRIWIFRKKADSESGNWTFTVTSGIDADGLVFVIAGRGVSDLSPLDIAYVRADHNAQSQGDATPTPPDITTISPGCLLYQLIGAKCTSGSSTTITVPANYTEAVAYESGGFSVNGAIAYRLQASAGLESAGDWDLAITSQDADAFVLALRPAAALEISGVYLNPPAGSAYVEHDGQVIPSDSVLFYESGQATGGSTTTASTGLDLVLDELVGLKWRNTSTGEESIITGNTAGPNSQITFNAVTTATANRDHFEVVADIASGDQIRFEDEVTAAAGEAQVEWSIVDITDNSRGPTYTQTLTGIANGTYQVSMSAKGVITLRRKSFSLSKPNLELS